MTAPTVTFIETHRGRFRALTWGPNDGETVLFLHGLTAVAEVWGPTIAHLKPGRRYVSIDQRGHGVSPHEGPYHPAQLVADTHAVIDSLGAPVHLVGHSMGARIAIILAARYPQLLRTVAIVDIGVEASVANVRETRAAIQSMPATFADEEEAFAFAFRRREPDAAGKAVFRARLKEVGGKLTWRGSPEAMVAIVESHRARNYWEDWKNVQVPSLYVRGGRSNEVSPAIAAKMKAANPSIPFVEFEDIPHNIPLIVPDRLAESLQEFWGEVLT